MYLAVIGKGPQYSLYGLVIDDACQISRFVRTLDELNFKQLAVLFSEIQRNGLPKNKEKFRSLGDDVFELKTRNGARIACFLGGSQLPKSLVLTHGFLKGTAKILQREKQRAVQWHREFCLIKDINKRIKQMEVEP
jgi:phage-related protein